MNHFRTKTLSSIKNSRQKYIAVGVATVAFGGAAVTLWMRPEQPKPFSGLQTLPSVNDLISEQDMRNVFKNNEKTLLADALKHRIDINSLPCNNPFEDRHAENEFSQGYLVAVYDGHSGFECADL